MASFIFRLPEKYLIYCNHSVFLLSHGFGMAHAIPIILKILLSSKIESVWRFKIYLFRLPEQQFLLGTSNNLN